MLMATALQSRTQCPVRHLQASDIGQALRLRLHTDPNVQVAVGERGQLEAGSATCTLEAFSSALSPWSTLTTAEAAASRITADAAACAASSGADRALGICDRRTISKHDVSEHTM